MKLLGATFIALGLALVALPVSAQETGQTTFTLEAHSEGSTGYFTLEGQTAKNPELVVPASQTITITLKGADQNGVHNIQVDGSDPSEYVGSGGESQVTYTFTSPASGTKQYWCVPHKTLGMAGTVRVAGSPANGGGNGEDGGNDSPGLGLLGVALAGAGAALIMTRRK